MRKWQNHLMSALILSLIGSCSNLESSHKVSSITLEKTDSNKTVLVTPEIPFNIEEAFFPLRLNKDGKIVPSYQWNVCVKKFIVCLKWEKKTVYIEDLSWFKDHDFGLTKRKKP